MVLLVGVFVLLLICVICVSVIVALHQEVLEREDDEDRGELESVDIER